MKEIKINPGMTLKLLAARFEANWEFDCPVIVFKPVLRFYEDGRSLDDAIEDVLISACVDGVLKDHQNIRQWNLKYLRGKANAVINGKDFPIAWMEAEEEEATFCLSKDGNITVIGWGDEQKEQEG